MAHTLSGRLLGAGAALSAIVLAIGLSIGPWGTTLTAAPPKSLAPVQFQTLMIYNQQDGSFPSYAAPANTRVIVRAVHVGVLVPMGSAPTGTLWVAPLDPGNTGWLGAFQAGFEFTKVSNFFGVQDRFATNMMTNVVLEPGQELGWHLTDAAGESAPFGASLLANISITGELIPIQ